MDASVRPRRRRHQYIFIQLQAIGVDETLPKV